VKDIIILHKTNDMQALFAFYTVETAFFTALNGTVSKNKNDGNHFT
jgi:hypothetical protein